VNEKLLLVEDEVNLGLSLSEFLKSKYGNCHWVKSIREAKELFETNQYSLALFDLGLPDGSGLELAQLLKKNTPKAKFIFLSALNDPDLKVEALEMGGLDYITKPFALKELMYRLERLFTVEKSVLQTYRFGKLSFVPSSYELIFADGNKEIIGSKECAILELLLLRMNEVLSREEIIEKIWGAEAFPSNRTVDNYIVSLRRWCDSDPHSGVSIQSIRSVGYTLRSKD
jgi:two-component system, OmpR family, alkaline phosphatase synthesis response regulator PhoP